MTGISIIIPTLNRADYLINTLCDLVKQDFDYSFEIIIVDQSDNKNPKFVEFSDRYPVVQYQFVSDFRGLPEARNYGASIAKYDCLLFLDDDISCNNSLLMEHFHAIQPKEVGIVAGGITEKYRANQKGPVGHFDYWTASPTRGFHNAGDFYVLTGGGGNFSVKREVFLTCHGIDEQLTQGAALYEETDFCLRVFKAGYKIRYYYPAHVYHLAADDGGCRVRDIKQYFKALTRNRTILIARHLKWYYSVSAYLYLFKLLCSYTIAYRKLTLFLDFIGGVQEGHRLGKGRVVNSYEIQCALP